MKTNNYTRAAENTPDIEVSCFHDTCRSQMDFNENIEVLQHSGYSSTSIGYYIDNGNLPGADSVNFTVKGKKSAMLKFVLENGRYYSDKEVKAMKKTELAEQVIEALDMTRNQMLIDYAQDRLPDIEGLEIVPDKELTVITTRGYSQGDYARVIYSPEDCLKVWGSKPAESTNELIGHYYWDAPIFAAFTINGEEYAYHDMPEYNEYKWKRAEFAAYVAKESGVPVDTLLEMLPDYPDYN